MERKFIKMSKKELKLKYFQIPKAEIQNATPPDYAYLTSHHIKAFINVDYKLEEYYNNL